MFKRIFSRLIFEVISPKFNLSKTFFYHFHYFINKINFFKNNNIKDEALLIWDVRSQAISFDVVNFVRHAFNFFYLKNIKEFNVVLFIPKKYKFKPFDWKEYSSYVNSNELKERIDNLIIPILSSYNCIDKICVINSYKDLVNICKKKITYPEFYNPYYYFPHGDSCKTYYKLLQENITPNPYLSSKNDSKVISKIYDKYQYITFSLRDYGYSPARNSSSSEIKLVYAFSKIINRKLVLVPDKISELKKYEIPSDVIICNEARNNLYERITLYKKSEINIFMVSGPSELSHFIKGSMNIILNWGVPSFDDSIEFQEKEYGLKFNDQPYLNLDGYLIWYKNAGHITVDEIMFAYNCLRQ